MPSQGFHGNNLLKSPYKEKEREAAGILAYMDAGLAAQISTQLSHGGSS